MGNKIFLASFIGLVILLRVLYDQFGTGDSLPNFEVLKTIFYIIYLPSIANLFIFFLISVLTPTKKEEWWEKKAKDEEKKETRLRLYIKSLAISCLIFVYGSFIFVALYTNLNLFGFLIVILTMVLVSIFRSWKMQKA